MENLSPIAEAIRHYKLNASGGYEEWSKVPRAPDYKMHVPAMGFDVTGHDEVRDVIFGWLTDIGAQQELVNIVEFGIHDIPSEHKCLEHKPRRVKVFLRFFTGDHFSHHFLNSRLL